MTHKRMDRFVLRDDALIWCCDQNIRHCEERSDAAVYGRLTAWIASYLAMTHKCMDRFVPRDDTLIKG